MIALGRGSGIAIGLTYSEWPLVAGSCPSLQRYSYHLNDRFWLKLPFSPEPI